MNTFQSGSSKVTFPRKTMCKAQSLMVTKARSLSFLICDGAHSLEVTYLVNSNIRIVLSVHKWGINIMDG